MCARDGASEANQTCTSLASEIRQLSNTAREIRAAVQLVLDAALCADGRARQYAEPGVSAAHVACAHCHHLAAEDGTFRLSIMPRLSEDPGSEVAD